MNPFSLLSIGAAGVSLVLSLWLLIAGISNQGLQSKMQDQQQDLMNLQQEFATLQQKAQGQQQQIQAGQSVADVGGKVLNDLGYVVQQKKDEKLKSLLARFGVQVPDLPPAGTKPAATPAPAPAP